MAKKLRKHLNLAPETSIANVAKLAAMLGAGGFQASPAAPAAPRAFQAQTNIAATIVVETESLANTKFILARAIGDFPCLSKQDVVVADLYTDW